MNEKILYITNDGKTARNWKIMTPTFFEPYTVYIKKIRTIFFHTLPAINHSITSYKYFKKLISAV